MKRTLRMLALACLALWPREALAQDDLDLAPVQSDAPQDAASDELAAPEEAVDATEVAPSETEEAPADAPDALDEPLDESSTVASDEAPVAETAEPAPTPEPAADRIDFSVGAGAGAGTLSLVRPTADGKQRLPRATFAALEITMRLHAWAQKSLSLEVQLAYHTSVGMQVETDPLFGLSQTVAMRVQRVELMAGPIVRLGDSPRALALAFPMGFALRTFVPELHQFGLPNLVLGGPQLRAELLAPLGELVMLRIGPEAQWLMLADDTLKRQGACCQGLALGAQASIEAKVGPAFNVSVAYRQSHGSIGSDPRAYSDIERFLTAIIAGRL